MIMYSKEDILKKLKTYDDDPNFHFDEPSHTYTYGDAIFTSVTTFLSRFHKRFDKEFMSKRTAQKENVTQEEILKRWKDKSDKACDLGTEVHLWIENYINGIYQKLPTDLEVISRINKFNVLYGEFLHKLEPIKCEQMIFSKDRLIAGMIDSLFLYKGNVFIIDHKTNGKMTTDEDTKYNKLLYPFSDYWENSLNKYSIQQSIYALILEELGIDVKAMYLLYIGPDKPGKLYKCLDMRTELKEFFKKEKAKEERRSDNINHILKGDDIDDIGLDI